MASGQHVWQILRDAAPVDDFWFHFLLFFVYPIVLYWVFGCAFLLLDLTRRPASLIQYKIQAPLDISSKELRQVITQVLVNQFVIGFLFFLTHYHLSRYWGIHSGEQLPTLSKAVTDLFVYLVVEEILFYYFHRLLHHPHVYKHIHKVHHQWTAPIAITAVYCHPIEHIVSNLLPVTMGKEEFTLRTHSHHHHCYVLAASQGHSLWDLTRQ
jgi:methylsterol monooxygenase